MNDYSTLLHTLGFGKPLTADQMRHAIGAMMDGDWSPDQAASFLAALAAKGETVTEVVGAAKAMRARSLRVAHELPLVVDVCGTGGDGAGTINVSTCVGFVVAACGVPVAKHGNRAASGRCGSADVLEAAGIPIGDGPIQAATRLVRDGFAFLFAQRYHPAMKAVAPVRRALRIRTIFNLLGPLTNPAGATHQVIGVASEAHLELVGDALRRLGADAGAVVHASNGIDEVAGDVPTMVYQFDELGVQRYRIDPAEFGVRAPLSTIAGGDVAENAAALEAILAGERSPRADTIALNAALALQVADRAKPLRDAFVQARAALASGAAYSVFEASRTAEAAVA